MFSYTQKSATWDEPQHLTTGYVRWRYGDHRIDPEHPPFLRMWAALPLLAMPGITADPRPIDQHTSPAWVGYEQFGFCHDFMYRDNDADRMLYVARFMIVLLGLLLGVLLFAWMREWLGFWPATATLGFYCLEPNLLAHATLVTTDCGITCFLFGTLYFLWRTCRRASFGNVAGLTVFFVLAIISKFSAVMLGPIVIVLLALTVWPRRTMNWRTAAGIVAVLFIASWLAVWAVYGFHYAPSQNPAWLFQFDRDETVIARIPTLARWIGWCDAHRLLPNAFAEGFLLGQSKAQFRGAYFAGQFSSTGWWYYFPVAFLIKTPVALILLLVAGLAVSVWRWRQFLQTAVFIVVPAALYLATAMTQKLNIGLRHILPVYPLALMLAGVAVAELVKDRRRLGVLGALAVFWVFEFARAYPSNLAFFNSFVGGPRNGYRYLVDSNLDWGQDLKPLKRWMDRNGVEQINLAYFGTADPAYYHMRCVHLPGAPFFANAQVGPPQLPGYVAVSATLASGVYFSGSSRTLYRPLLEREPVARIGYSIFVYRVDQPWWQ